MSIKTQIDRIKANILLAYEELEKKGATLPSELTVENLAPTIASLVLAPTLEVTDDGNGNVTVTGVTITDNDGNVTISGVSASDDNNGNVTVE